MNKRTIAAPQCAVLTHSTAQLPQLFVSSTRLLLALLLAMLVTSCSQTQSEQALIGNWQSRTSQTRFAFLSNGTFQWTRPEGQPITGKYWSVGNDDSLRNAQFNLDDRIGIRFEADGQAFYIYVDGAGGGELFYRTE